ncbi:MAG: hypothetical protein RR334_03530 [Clostridia bacterium]
MNKEIKLDLTRYYIVSAERAGIFIGNIKERNGTELLMTNVRRIYYWEGANSISQLAVTGPMSPSNCKFSVAVEEVLFTNVLEINLCSEKAEKVIKGVKEWKK